MLMRLDSIICSFDNPEIPFRSILDSEHIIFVLAEYGPFYVAYWSVLCG